MTNYERIMSMTLEELADEMCENCSDCSKCRGFEYCRNGYRGTRAWLAQEAEE